jgi:hypothetical protein
MQFEAWLGNVVVGGSRGVLANPCGRVNAATAFFARAFDDVCQR